MSNPLAELSLVDLNQMAIDTNAVVRAKAAFNMSASAEILTLLSVDKEGFVRSEVAKNARTPVTVLGNLASDEDVNVRKGVATNSSAPVGVLEKLAKDADSLVQSAVAANVIAPPDLLRKLAKLQHSENVLVSIAGNTSCPADLLETLAKGAPDVCHEVALNINTGVSTLEMLARHPYSGVREAIAINERTPSNILSLLASDEDESVCEAARSNRNFS